MRPDFIDDLNANIQEVEEAWHSRFAKKSQLNVGHKTPPDAWRCNRQIRCARVIRWAVYRRAPTLSVSFFGTAPMSSARALRKL
jgi:hypothetical protein